MNSIVKLLVVVGIFVNVSGFPHPNQADGSSESSESVELFNNNLGKCLMRTYFEHEEEINNFIDRFLQFANSSENFLSKIGHEDFDIILFKEKCFETEHILMEFLKDMEVKFSKCFDEKSLHLIDLALDFVKSLIDFQCNMNEEQLGYFAESNKAEFEECMEESKYKLGTCFADIKPEDFDIRAPFEEQICKLELDQHQQCLKNVLGECKPNASNGLILVLDFVFNYVETKFECK